MIEGLAAVAERHGREAIPNSASFDMKQYLFALAAIVVAMVLAFVVGVQFQRSSQPDISAELRRLRSVVDKQSDAPNPSAPLVIAPGSDLSREELREEIRAAVQSLRAADAPAEGDSAPGSDDAGRPARDLSPETVVARDQATAVIDTALKRGKWFASDREAFRRITDQMTDAEAQFELFRRFSVAVNDGSLKPELEGPPL